MVATLVNSTKDGGATLVCAAYSTRTLRLPGLTGGCAVVIASMKRLSSPVGTRGGARAADTFSIVSSSFGRALAGLRRDVEDGREVQELQLVTQVLVEDAWRRPGPRAFIRSHLLAAMMMPRPASIAAPAMAPS